MMEISPIGGNILGIVRTATAEQAFGYADDVVNQNVSCAVIFPTRPKQNNWWQAAVPSRSSIEYVQFHQMDVFHISVFPAGSHWHADGKEWHACRV